MEKNETTAVRGRMNSKRGGQIGSDRDDVEDVGLRWRTRGSVIHRRWRKHKSIRQISQSSNKSWLQINLTLKGPHGWRHTPLLLKSRMKWPFVLDQPLYNDSDKSTCGDLSTATKRKCRVRNRWSIGFRVKMRQEGKTKWFLLYLQ